MPLLLPQGGAVSEDMHAILAALQVAFGKVDATGRWITPAHDPTAFTIAGAGNSWAVTRNTLDSVSYCLIGEHAMVLNLNIATSALTVATPTTLLRVRIPDDYVMQGDLASGTVGAARTCWAGCEIDSGGPAPGMLFCTSGSDTVALRFVSAANFATNVTSIRGQILLDVKRKGT